MKTKKQKNSLVHKVVTVAVVLGSLWYFSKGEREVVPIQPSVVKPVDVSRSTTSPETGVTSVVREPITSQAPSQSAKVSQDYPAAFPADRVTISQPPTDPVLPPDLQRQLDANPPQVPPELEQQLNSPPPELPEDLKAQLNAPPPEIPEDIKRAMQAPPRTVTIDEVNNPALLKRPVNPDAPIQRALEAPPVTETDDEDSDE